MGILDVPGVSKSVADGRYLQSFTHPAMAKLTRNAENVVIAVLSDSTGQTQLSGTNPQRWPNILCSQIATLFPAYKVIYHEWSDDGGQSQYNGTTYPDVVVQAGTGTGNAGGPFQLDLYNGSISGSIGIGFLGVGPAGINRYPGIIGNLVADLIFISFGQNNVLTDKDMTLTSLVEQVALDNEQAVIAVIAQNPRLSDLRQAVHASGGQSYAARRGFGFIDVHQVFIDAGTPASSLTANTWYVNTGGVPLDGIHPSYLGSQQWSNTVLKYLSGAQFPQQQPSTLSTAVEPITKNADFADAGFTFKNWTLVGGAVGLGSQVVWDRPNSNSSVQKLTAPVANVAQSETQTVVLPPSWRSKWVSLCVRMWVPTITNGGSSTSGIVTLGDGTQTVSGGAWGTSGKGAWVWVHVPMKITAGTSNAILTMTLFSEYSASNASTTGYIYIDRAFIIPGRVLRDMPLRRNGVFSYTDIVIRRGKWSAPESGSSGYQGVATMVAGTVTVAATSVAAGDRVRLTAQSAGAGVGTWGELAVTTITATTSFIITSASSTDTRIVLWEIVGNAN
jgi:hypothetical protein